MGVQTIFFELQHIGAMFIILKTGIEHELGNYKLSALNDREHNSWQIYNINPYKNEFCILNYNMSC